jgi:hypothetical protein
MLLFEFFEYHRWANFFDSQTRPSGGVVFLFQNTRCSVLEFTIL